MKRTPVAILGAIAALGLSPALAADHPATGQYSLESMQTTSKPEGRFGSPAGSLAYDREIVLGKDTTSVTVARGETVRFLISATGREFRWRFDTLKSVDSFPLSNIVPTDVQANPNVKVYVSGARQ